MHRDKKKPLRVMKFGGTSVADATCIARVVDIVRAAARESDVVVVVSAMSGVTNRLISAANYAVAGNEQLVTEIFGQLRKQHEDAASLLICSRALREVLDRKLKGLLADGELVCQDTIRSRKLTPKTLDAISGLGERLSAPLVAAALSEAGVSSAALDATELVVTDSVHGGAEPRIDLTKDRCRSRITPLLRQGIVPVVTGFIGATDAGVPTTLGRGGSDFSATVLGAALEADEVVIWTDVTGMLTADPKLVADACTIAEISYEEASELAHFGAKVLHPKTLRPVAQIGIPIWIKNTFAPGEHGTKITPDGLRKSGGALAISCIHDAAHLSPTEFSQFETSTSLITVVGRNLQIESAAIDRALGILKETKNILAATYRSSDSSVTLSVPARELEVAAALLHRELDLGSALTSKRPVAAASGHSPIWNFESERASAD